MKGDNITPWSEYAWTAADPLTVDEECAEPCDCLPDPHRRTRLVLLAAILAVLVLLTIVWWK